MPMTPESYRAAARKLRKLAEHLEARCTPQTPRERAALTSAVHGLAHYARALWARHHRRPLYEPDRDEIARQREAAGNYASTPDSAAVSITGDIDIRVKLAMDAL